MTIASLATSTRRPAPVHLALEGLVWAIDTGVGSDSDAKAERPASVSTRAGAVLAGSLILKNKVPFPPPPACPPRATARHAHLLTGQLVGASATTLRQRRTKGRSRGKRAFTDDFADQVSLMSSERKTFLGLQAELIRCALALGRGPNSRASARG